MDKKPSSIILLFLMALAPIGAIIFTPGLPDIAKYFSIPLAKAQWVMTIYLLGYALGMLFYGPIANAFGRKIALYTGLIIACMASLLAGLSKPLDSFTLLFFSRFFMSFGACCGYTLTLTIIGDYYKRDARKMIGALSFGAVVLPYVSAVLGGVLVQHLGWNMPFYVMALFSLVLIISSVSLPETAPVLNRDALNLVKICGRYKAIVKVPGFLYYVLLAGSQVGLFYLFGTLSSILGVDVIEMTPKHYGIFNLVTAFGFAVGNPLVAYLAHKQVNPMKVISIGMISILSCSALYFIFFISGHINRWTLFGPSPLLSLGIVTIWATGASQALHQEQDKANASSLISFITAFIAVLTVFISGFFDLRHPLLMPIFFVVAQGVALVNILLLKKSHRPS